MVDHIKRQLAAQGISPPKPTGSRQNQRTTPAPPNPSPATCEAPTAKESGATTIILHPYAISRAGSHFPGRSRHVITGPDTPGLTAALVAAVEAFHQATTK